MRINLGIAVLTIESKPNAIGEFLNETMCPGDGRLFAILSTLSVIAGGALAWFA